MESEKVRPLFKKEEEYARAAASSWIAHPAVRSALDALRPSAVAVTALLLPHMADQVQCMRFCWRICGIGPVYPDGSEEPNPFDPKGPAPWSLTEREREQAGYIAAAFRLLVRTVAARLCDVGVPLDQEWDGDQKVCRSRCHRVSIDQSAQLERIHPGSWADTTILTSMPRCAGECRFVRVTGVLDASWTRTCVALVLAAAAPVSRRACPPDRRCHTGTRPPAAVNADHFTRCRQPPEDRLLPTTRWPASHPVTPSARAGNDPP